ncbi:MAG: hypothetical protein K0U86_05615 [Planctomycetes bacterium]|nr:hypothetical protein [Planctomycetota bacterium]MCH9776187.1 hypothetical protein [Planctomycetota bacterium]MCH9792463.1 hypothetical protein [Planctomycetota bacterium]
MMSLIKNMNLKKVCLMAGCLLTIGMVSLSESNAGAVPWTFNALFGPAQNGPRAYQAGYAPVPRSYTSNYGGVAMAGATNTSFYGPTTTYYGPRTTYYSPARNRAQARRTSRAAYRWYLLNNPQVVGVNYGSFSGGNSYQFAGAAYGPGCCSPCGLSGCSTGNCASGGCSTGQCGVNYNSASSAPTTGSPIPDPNSGKKVPVPRDVENTPPKTFADEPMIPGKTKSNVEDSGFGARSYEKKPMPKSDAEDLFKQPLKRDAIEKTTPGSTLPPNNFGTEKPKIGTDKKSEDLFGPSGTKTDAFKVTPDGKIPKTTIPQKKAAPTKKPAEKTPKAEQETGIPQLRVQPLNLDQKITWKSATRSERLTIRAHFSAPVIAKQNVPSNSGWFAITDSQKIASK